MIKPSSDPVEHQSRAAGQGPSGPPALVGARGDPPRCGSRLPLRQATEGTVVTRESRTARRRGSVAVTVVVLRPRGAYAARQPNKWGGVAQTTRPVAPNEDTFDAPGNLPTSAVAFLARPNLFGPHDRKRTAWPQRSRPSA